MMQLSIKMQNIRSSVSYQSSHKMIRWVVFSILFSRGFGAFDVDYLTPEQNKPVILPQDAGTHVNVHNINGTLTSDSLSQLTITKLELMISNASQLEPRAVCSPPSLKSLHLGLGKTPITVTKAMLKNCEKLETLHVGGLLYGHHLLAIDGVADLPNLKELTLTFMNLQKVTKEYFKNLASLENLTLENCLIDEIDTNTFNDLTKLKNLRILTETDSTQSFDIISKVPLKVKKFTFDGLNGTLTKSKMDVTELRFSSYQLEGIEAGAACPTSSVKKLNLHLSALKPIKLTKEVLKNCENVEELRISEEYKQLTETEKDTFQNLPKLKIFSSELVKIKHVTKDTFKNSLLLENFKLFVNDPHEIDSDAFNLFQHLKTVEISLQNRYSPEQTQKLFTNTMKADKIVLSNLCGKLPLPQFKEVKELSLHFQKLDEVEAGVCSLPTLKKFSLHFFVRENLVLKKNAFNCENLEQFFFISAMYYDVPEEAFQHLPHLKLLFLESLHFPILKREYFKNLQSLEKLVLFNCDIDEINTNAFEDLVSLKVLQISNTRELSHFPANLLRKNVKLEKLSLTSNYLSNITFDQFKELPLLTTLDLSMNPIESFNAEIIAQNVPNLKNFNIHMTSFSFDVDSYTRFQEELKKKLNVTFHYESVL